NSAPVGRILCQHVAPPLSADNPSALKFEDEQSLVPVVEFDGVVVCVRVRRARTSALAVARLHAPSRRLRRAAAAVRERRTRAVAEPGLTAGHTAFARRAAEHDSDASRAAFAIRTVVNARAAVAVRAAFHVRAERDAVRSAVQAAYARATS